MAREVVYVSGPMTGLPNSNYPAFNGAALVYRSLGYVVLNPAENFGGLRAGSNATRQHLMRIDINNLMQSDYVVALQGWEKSIGARTELQIAFELGIPVYDDTNGWRIRPHDLTSRGEYFKQATIEGGQHDESDRKFGRISPNYKPFVDAVNARVDQRRAKTEANSERGTGLLSGCTDGGSPSEPHGKRTAQSRGAPTLGEEQVDGPGRLSSETSNRTGDSRWGRYETHGQGGVAGSRPPATGDRSGPRTTSQPDRLRRRLD